MPPDSEALRQVRATAQILEGLREQDATWAGPPAGSSMAADDEVWALMPCSEVVRNALLSAHDHLDLVRLVLLHVQPARHRGDLRGVARGAGWRLPRPVGGGLRRRRGAASACTRAGRREDYRYRHAFHQSQLHSEDPARAQHSQPWVEHWEGRQLNLAAVRAGLPKASAKVTSIVTWVARELFGSGADSYATLLGLWQSSSSSAHGLGWGAFVRPGLNVVGHDPTRGLSGFNVVLDVDDAADQYETCVALLVLADGLFRQRCSR